MSRLHLLVVLALVVAGCAPELPSLYDYDRPFPRREVDGVDVHGPYSADDVAAILALVRGQTAEPVLSIATPLDISQRYYRREIDLDAIPADTAEVRTGARCPGRCGSGSYFYLSARGGAWAVRGRGQWMG